MKWGAAQVSEGRSTWGWTPQEHLRTALHLLGELEGELHARGSVVPGGYSVVRLLAATRRQLWLAVTALEPRRFGPSWSVARRRVVEKRSLAAIALQRVVAWTVLAVGFALKCGWRYTGAALRALWRA